VNVAVLSLVFLQKINGLTLTDAHTDYNGSELRCGLVMSEKWLLSLEREPLLVEALDAISIFAKEKEELIMEPIDEIQIFSLERRPLMLEALEGFTILKQEKEVYYSPTYTRTDLTDLLHEKFDFRTDYETIDLKNLKNQAVV